jgi:pilus assembly protein CpaC
MLATLAAIVPAGTTTAQPRLPGQWAEPAPTPAPAEPNGVHAQPITVRAGIGVVLRLPQPAATMVSANPSVVRIQPASPTSLFMMGVTAGRSTVLAMSDTGAVITQYDVTVQADDTPGPRQTAEPQRPDPGRADGRQAIPVSAALAAAIQRSIVQSVVGASSLRASPSGTSLLLAGNVANAAAADMAMAIARGQLGEQNTLVNQMLVLGSIQVNVRVRIAEMNRSVTRELGFNWQALGGSLWKLGVLTGAPAATVSSLTNTALNRISTTYSSGGWDVNGVIDALAVDQLVTILAEPNLTAQSGETASFLAGGEFPIPISSSTGIGTSISVVFKQFGVSLAVVPTVLSPTRVNLRVRPEVSQLSTNGAVSIPSGSGTLTIPALTVRRAETTVELGSGQSFAIAGLLQRTSTETSNGVPGLGDVPVLGALFKSNQYQRGETELVIIVTPYLVVPASDPGALSLPTDGIRPADEPARLFLGRQTASAPTFSPGRSAPLSGFILK